MRTLSLIFDLALIFTYHVMIDVQEEEEEEEEEQARMKESVSSQKDVALEEMTASTSREAVEQAKSKTLEKHEQLCELSRALAVLASASVCICITCFYKEEAVFC